MKASLLSAKYCNELGYYYDKKIPIDVAEDNYWDYAVPFHFGFVNAETKYDFHVPNIRTVGEQYIIQTFRDLKFKSGDKVKFDEKLWNVESVRASYIQSSKFKRVKQYFLTIR